jgi:hypothetical protein
MKKILGLISVVILLFGLVGCGGISIDFLKNTGGDETLVTVPIFSLNDFSSVKSFATKSIDVSGTSSEIDRKAFAFYTTMFQGFIEVPKSNIVDDKYKADVVNMPQIQVNVSGSKFTIDSPENKIYLEVNIDGDTFTVFEKSAFAYNIPAGCGIIYREAHINGTFTNRMKTNFTATGNLKYYCYSPSGAEDGHLYWSGNLHASWFEIFKNSQIIGLFVTKGYVDEYETYRLDFPMLFYDDTTAVAASWQEAEDYFYLNLETSQIPTESLSIVGLVNRFDHISLDPIDKGTVVYGSRITRSYTLFAFELWKDFLFNMSGVPAEKNGYFSEVLEGQGTGSYQNLFGLNLSEAVNSLSDKGWVIDLY